MTITIPGVAVMIEIQALTVSILDIQVREEIQAHIMIIEEGILATKIDIQARILRDIQAHIRREILAVIVILVVSTVEIRHTYYVSARK